MTLRDAILLVGGLQDNASLAAAEISRLRSERREGEDSLATVLAVPLDSSYVVDETGYIPPFLDRPHRLLNRRHSVPVLMCPIPPVLNPAAKRQRRNRHHDQQRFQAELIPAAFGFRGLGGHGGVICAAIAGRTLPLTP